MPSVSKVQQGTAGAAYAAAKGETSPSELRGPAKSMYKSMGKTELRKFAKTKTKGLPKRKHPKESVEQIKAMITEGGHKAGCKCAFCTNYKGKGFGKKKDEDKPEPEEPKETPMSEGQDDIGKLNMSPEAKSYARRGGLASMKRQPKDYIRMVAADTNQKGKQAGFKNFDAAEKPSGGSVGASAGLTKKKNESLAQEVVDTMLNG